MVEWRAAQAEAQWPVTLSSASPGLQEAQQALPEAWSQAGGGLFELLTVPHLLGLTYVSAQALKPLTRNCFWQ